VLKLRAACALRNSGTAGRKHPVMTFFDNIMNEQTMLKLEIMNEQTMLKLEKSGGKNTELQL
jgi:hypothetical protein